MRITFVVSYLELTGGHRAVLEIGARLARRGHDVTLLYPARSILSRRNELLRRLPLPDRLRAPFFRRNGDVLDWFPFPGKVVRVEDLVPDAAPDADVVVATAWQTATRVARFPQRAGAKAYFIQHYETWSGRQPAVDATWRMPFLRIVSSAWLAELARERFGIEDVHVVPYGVDTASFWPAAVERDPDLLRVGLLYHVEPWKGVADALEALRRVRRERTVRPVAFGVFPPGSDLPDDCEYHRAPTREALRHLYSSLDVFLCASWSETGPMTVPEAMACGACVVSSDVGNVRMWTEDGRAAFLAPPRDVDELTRQLARALDDESERRRRAARSLEVVKAFTWDRATDEFERALGAAR
jgi:glycosyltransferase involved in cell wall biosynthesis